MAFYAVDSKDVTTAGTAEALTTRTLSASSVLITAKSGNTDVMYVVDPEDNAKKHPIEPGQSITIPLSGQNTIQDIEIDSAQNGEGVDWVAV